MIFVIVKTRKNQSGQFKHDKRKCHENNDGICLAFYIVYFLLEFSKKIPTPLFHLSKTFLSNVTIKPFFKYSGIFSASIASFSSRSFSFLPNTSIRQNIFS